MGRLTRSVYGSSTLLKPIYGLGNNNSDSCACSCIPTFPPIDQITSLISIVSSLELLFTSYFKPTSVTMPLHARMSVTAGVSPIVGVRVIWKFENPGLMFDRTNEIHRLQLKMIYQNNNWNWRYDPLFV